MLESTVKYYGMAFDTAEPIDAEARLLRAVIDASSVAIFLTDPQANRFLYVNERACRLLGFSRAVLLRKNPVEALGKPREQLLKEYADVIATGPRGVRTESGYVRNDGSDGWIELHRRALTTASGHVIVTACRDITESKSLQERAAYLALHDELTGLANRRLLVERLGQFQQVAGQSENKLAVILFDIERLRSVNTMFGRRAGDTLLQQLGERLREASGPALVGRVTSDCFAAILPVVNDRTDAAQSTELLIRSCFGAPYAIDGTEVKVGAKAGVALFPDGGIDPDTLLANAEAALRRAKKQGERHVFYTPDLGATTGAWLPFETKLVRALEKGELVLHYQPKIDCVSGKVVGLEALLRWDSPELGLIQPGKFIPIMEGTGMILEVGAWALQRAALDHRKLIESGFGPLRVAVNVSAIQVRQADFVQSVQQAIRSGVSPAAIDLEMTESLVMEDIEENIRKLREVAELGVEVAIDDFGTGYSSLSYLAKLPAQALKIDRSFIAAMLEDCAAHTLVQTIISLAHALRLTVIAEGVEDERQAKLLRLLRCDQLQGNLISRPVPLDEVISLLRDSSDPGRHPWNKTPLR